MADLVEFVIDGILQREQMQKHAKMQQNARAASAQPTVARENSFQHIMASQTASNVEKKDEALWEVSRQFEAIFVQQMMTEMRKTVSKSEFMPSGYAEDVHASMMDEAIAQASSKRGSFGIADNIYRQLEAAQNIRANAVQKETLNIQEISNTADKLEMDSGSLVTGVGKHAY